MARTKRKNNPLQPEAAASAPTERVYRTAGYARLSIEDGNRPGSDTLDGQEKLITEYIKSNPAFAFAGLWADNGHTGTDFERPQFEALMEAVKRGEIDCIVCKDLSRFGRNYKETGNYLERIFPFLNVRFIAINDNFDTLTAERNEFGFIVPLKNLMNETYSRDISQKVSSALAAKERRGEFIGVWAPYGYSKSESDRHKLVINPETAPIIREIFAMRMKGTGYLTIVQMLNDRGVPSPSAYLFQKGLSQNEKYRNPLWTQWNIKEILRNEVYIGNLVQGKRTLQSYKKAWEERYAPQEQWRISRNTHEAIIDETAFRTVQVLAEQRKIAYETRTGIPPEIKTDNIFGGLIFCADCGRALTRRHIYTRKNGEKFYYYNYVCPTSVNKVTACTRKNIHEVDLLSVVTDTIQCHLKAAAELERRIDAIHQERAAAENKALETQMKAATRELERSRKLDDSLYQNLVDGIVSRQEYQALKKEYEQKCSAAEMRLLEIRQQQKAGERFSADNPMFATLRKFYDGTELSAELTHALISRIEADADKNISISLNYQDEFEVLLRYAVEESMEATL